MIAKAKSISHGGKGIDYALNKDKAEVIDKRHIVGENGAEIKKEFGLFQNQNQRCKNNDISFVLSPEPKDGKKLTNKDFKAISDDFLKKMKLDKHQAIVIKHSDKEHAHLHVFVNRIDSNGKAYKDNFISKQSQTVADKIAQEKGLTRASVVKEFNKAMHKDLKNQILEKHKIVLQHKPKDFSAYKDLMKSRGVTIHPTINKANRLQGFRVGFQGVNLKASEIHRSMSLNEIGVSKSVTIGKALKGSEMILNGNPALKIAIKAIRKSISKGLNY